MLVADIGEFDLIETLERTLRAEGASSFQGAERPGYHMRASVGDDAAAWDGPAGTSVLTTDALVEGVHFSLESTSWADLGWKCLAANLSDVAAMGCEPLSAVITMGLRGDLPVDGLVELYRGMAEASRRYATALVGGDIVGSPVFFLAVSVVGASAGGGDGPASGGPLLTRRSAVGGDVVAVTGSLGCSAAGLRMAQSGLRFDGATEAHFRDAHNRPAPRLAEGSLIARNGVTTAIDVSDGLVDDLGKVCKASGVGARVYSHRVPADRFLRTAFADDWMALALTGGEDYELLFTAPMSTVEEVAPLLSVPVTVIGDVVDAPPGATVLDEWGAPIPIERGGWDHFGRS